MRKKSFLVCGVGVNDAEYPVAKTVTTNGVRRLVKVCQFYRVWSDMLLRCYSSKRKSKAPTYEGCTVADEWLTFSAFRAWMTTQQWEGLELDKDVLCPGNKVYGPDTCVFLPHAVNTFLIDSAASRGAWPVGVHLDKRNNKFQAHCCNPETRNQDSLGHFKTPEEAHEAWRARKHQHACRYADQQTDPRIAQALRTRYSQKQDQTK